MRTNCVRQNYNIVKGAKLGEGGREGGREDREVYNSNYGPVCWMHWTALRDQQSLTASFSSIILIVSVMEILDLQEKYFHLTGFV